MLPQVSAFVVTGVAGIAVLIASPAAAQTSPAPQARLSYQLQEKYTVGGLGGFAINRDRNSGHGGLDLSVSVEVPIHPTWRLRGDVGRAAWTFDKREDAPEAPAIDTISLTRATIGLIRTVQVAATTSPLGIYGGGGAGIYHYGFELGRAAHPTKFGTFAIGGVEYIFADEHKVLIAEIQFHSVFGPNPTGTIIAGSPESVRSQVHSTTLLVISGLIGAKWRF